MTILGLNTGTLDITFNSWGHQVGLEGEKSKLHTEAGAESVQWTKETGPANPVTWFKTYFDEPEGKDPLAIRVTGMTKGMIWVNGKSIGRYWENYLSPAGLPTQSE